MYLHRASVSSIRADAPPTLRLAVACHCDVRNGRAPLHIRREPAPGRELLHPGARQPGPRRRALVPALDRRPARVRCVTPAGRAPRCASSPMKYRPPESCDASSTDHTVGDRVHARSEEAAVLQLRLCRLESRREHHVDLPAVVHRDGPRELVCQPAKLRLTWYAVSLSPPANWTLAPLPSVQWKPLAGVAPRRPACGLRHEDAIKIPELAVPGRAARGGLERDPDAERRIEAGFDHAALVGTVTAVNRLSRLVDHRNELLHQIEEAALPRDVRTGGMPDPHPPHQRCAHARESEWTLRWCPCAPRTRCSLHRSPSVSATLMLISSTATEDVSCVSTRTSVLVTV